MPSPKRVVRRSLHIALLVAAAASLGAGAAAVAADKPAPQAAKAGVATWAVDKAQSKIGFRSSFSGMAFEGTFAKWDAQIAFDPKNLAASKATVTIDPASARTGDSERDSTLPESDWFNVAKFPRASFVATAFKDLGGGKYQAVGPLTIKGVSKTVTLPFTLTISGDTARMAGQLTLKRNDFGVGQGQFAGADTVPFEVVVPVTVVAKKAS